MYPVEEKETIPDPVIVGALLADLQETEEWTLFSIRELAYEWGPLYHVSLSDLFQTIMAIHRQYPQYTVFIPTAASFATITAGSPGTEAYLLRSYLQDDRGRHISHVRIHRQLKEVQQWKTRSTA